MLPLNESYLALKNDMNQKLFTEKKNFISESKKKMFGHKEIKFYDNIKGHNEFKNCYQDLFVNMEQSKEENLF